MSRLKEILDRRTLSGFGVSIGTGIALETLFEPDELVDPDRIFEKYPIEKVKKFYIDIHTIVRNILAALTSEEKAYLFKRDIARYIVSTVEEELSIITGLMHDNGIEFNVVRPNRSLLRKFPQHTFNGSQADVVKQLSFDVEAFGDFKIFRGGDKNTLLISHISADLIAPGRYKLLESHTGRIIERSQFNKRYTVLKGLDMSILPFTLTLLKIFGDGTKYTKALPPSTRRSVYTGLLAAGVNPSKTEAWIKHKLKGKF